MIVSINSTASSIDGEVETRWIGADFTQVIENFPVEVGGIDHIQKPEAGAAGIIQPYRAEPGVEVRTAVRAESKVVPCRGRFE